MTTEEFSCHSTIYGNLYMTKSSQKGEASIYHVWKRKSTIYCKEFGSVLLETSQNPGNVIVVQGTASPINFVQIICAPMCLECWLKTCWWFEGISKHLSVNKNAQLFHNIFVCNLNIQHNQLRDISFGRPNAYNCIVKTSKDVTLYGNTSHVERLN